MSSFTGGEGASPILIQKYAQQTRVFTVLRNLVGLCNSIGNTSQEGSTKEGSFGMGSEPLTRAGGRLAVGSEYPIHSLLSRIPSLPIYNSYASAV